MHECSSCGTELTGHETRCPTCGKITGYYHRQRRCLHCGSPVAEKTKICMMCHQPVDSLPLSRSIFSGSWLGIGLGVLIIVGIVIWVAQAQADDAPAVTNAPLPDTPTATLTPQPTRTPTSTGTATPTPTETPRPTPTPLIYVVESGDTLLYIAQRFGVSVDELVDLNDIADVRGLSVGQALVIPDVGLDLIGEGNPLPPQMVYVIKEGDTLSSIAYEIGTPMQAIVRANPGLNLDLIYPGQEIVVPLSTPTPTATPTPLPTETPTPRPDYQLPSLLSPPAGQVMADSTVLFNWTATHLLADDEFYVLQLTWSNGVRREYWVQHTSWRLAREDLPATGVISWTVVIKRRTNDPAQERPAGNLLTAPGQPRTFEWR